MTTQLYIRGKAAKERWAVKNMYGKWDLHLKKWFTEGYDKNSFTLYREEIDQYNADMLWFFNTLVLSLLAVLFVSGFFTGYVAPMRPIYIGIALVTLAEMAAGRLALFKRSGLVAAAVFCCMAKIYVFCIFSGVYYSPDMPAISFSVFLIVLSILFIVKPWQLNLFNFLATVVFCLCSMWAKPPEIVTADVYNNCIFYGVSAAVSFWIVKLRLGFIRNEKLLTAQRDTDILTTLPNRRRFNAYVQEAFEKQKDGKISIFMMDIDYFKAYNDTKGHIAGDYCLESIGKALGRFGGEWGLFFARYGGEEFVAVDTRRDLGELETAAHEIVRCVYELGLPHESSSFKRITISVGYAGREESGAKTYIELLECADRALYSAKNQGRNKVAGFKREH